jgi:hypothetical protein
MEGKKDGTKFSHTAATSSKSGTAHNHTKYADAAKTKVPHRVGKKKGK